MIYQVYVRSFQDTDGNGLGDLAGVIARLDYLTWLGVDALWLSPFHPSPLLDGGYDVSDFCDIDPRFGDLTTFDRLVAQAHGLGLKVVLDFVPNHTSDQHPWFAESRSSRTNPKRDWYVWHDGRDGGPPNGWRTMLGGPAWQHDAGTGQFYYHAFLPQQPDLNWRNPQVREAMDAVLCFWLDRGVDGFRIDAVPHLVEDDLLREDPPEALAGEGMPVQAGRRHVFTSDRPETHAVLAAWRRLVDGYGDHLLIGEAHLPIERVVRYYGLTEPSAHLPFNFLLLSTAWDARALAAALDQYVNLLPPGASANWVLGNHDEPRVASRFGPAQARVAAMLAFTVGGTPFLYNGDELGLEDVTQLAKAGGAPNAQHPDVSRARDPQRTPMPWDGSQHSGFTTGDPWLPLGHPNAGRDVAAQAADPGSMLSFYRRLIALRRAHPALVRGRYRAQAAQGSVLIYMRETEDTCMLVALNIGGDLTEVTLATPGKVVLSTHHSQEATCPRTLTLQSHEGIIVQVVGHASDSGAE